MAGLKGLTINTAPEAEPHLYAEDDAAIYQAICGADGVFQIGQQCESQVISNNKVRVKDGVIIVGGHFARIPYGDYIDFEIANGQTGKKRNDILIAKFVTTGSGGIDTFTGEVKQGAAATGEATDPALTQNDLYQGGKIREMPLYRVKLDGLSITEVEPMFDLIPTIPTLNSYLSKLSNCVIEEGSNSNGKYRKWRDGTLEMWGDFDRSSAITEKAGSLYASPSPISITFPVQSLTRPNINLTITAGGAIWGKPWDSASSYLRDFSYSILAATQWSNAAYHVSYYARGTWK